MPQGKRGQRCAERPVKGPSRTAAKTVPSKPVKRKPAEAVAKPVAKRRAAKAVDRPVAKRKAVQAAVKPVAKRKAADVVAKPVKKRSKADADAVKGVELAVVAPALEPVVEQEIALAVGPAVEDWIAAPAADPDVDGQFRDSTIERVVDLLTTEPVAQHESLEAAAEAELDGADFLFKPFTERRVTFKSLLERRLADPSSKERRVSGSLAEECAAAQAAAAPGTAAAAKERKAKIAADAAELKAAGAARESDAVPGFADRRVSERRAGGGIEAELRVRAQQNLFNETALWMRRGGAVLIGLNALLILVVLILWHARSSQTPETSEMQKATMAEMRRATAASEVAAYASCLGSQTARSILMQMKGGAVEQRLAAASNGGGLQTVAAVEAQGAQIQFDVEKTTSVDVHVPVLFHLGIENVGKSPALNAKVWGAVKVLDSAQEPDFKVAEAALSKEAIAPGDPAKVILYSADNSGLVIPLNDATYQQVKSGAAYVVAYGRVVYTDIFGVRHWAEFCHNITEPAGAGKHLNKCAAYNGAGVIEPAARPNRYPMPSQNASLALPEISCQLPKDRN